MTNYSICTYEYDSDLEKLLMKRLLRQNVTLLVTASESKHALNVKVDNDIELRKLCSALSELILLDLRHFEIARIVNLLAFSIEDKKLILSKAIRSSVQYMDYSKTADGIYDYLKKNELIVLEGYLRFMLQEVLETWSVCVDVAAEELILHEEYMELMKLLTLFTELRATTEQVVNIIFHSDGSCTITDGNEMRIECAADSEDGILSMLIGMSPNKIIVYDLSSGRFDALKSTIKLLFGSKVDCYS